MSFIMMQSWRDTYALQESSAPLHALRPYTVLADPRRKDPINHNNNNDTDKYNKMGKGPF